MALPPPTADENGVNQTFLREVDDNLRRDQAAEFARKNAKFFIAAVILFLAGIGGVFYWQEHKKQASGAETEQIADIYRELGEGKMDTAPAKLDALAESRSPALRASALFTRAAVALESNDRATAIATYQKIIDDEDMPAPDHDAAVLRLTALQFDQLKPADVITRLAPYAQPGNPWYGSAAEMTALALIKQNKNAEAGKIYAALAADKRVPESLRARSVQIASSLGADASNALSQAR